MLSRALNFAILTKNVNYADYLLAFELLFRDIEFCEIPSYDKEFLRSRLRDCAFTSLGESSKINENNLSKEEHLALEYPIKNRNLVTQNADIGDIVVTLNKNDYISKTKMILSDSSKFEKVSIDQNKVLNHIIHAENRIIDVPQKLKKKKNKILKTNMKIFILSAQVLGFYMVVLKLIRLLRMVFHISDLFYQL